MAKQNKRSPALLASGNNIWLKRNSWFEVEVVPSLQSHVKKLLR